MDDFVQVSERSCDDRGVWVCVCTCVCTCVCDDRGTRTRDGDNDDFMWLVQCDGNNCRDRGAGAFFSSPSVLNAVFVAAL